MGKFSVYITRKIPEIGLDILRRECGNVEVNPEPRSLSKRELMRKVRNRDGILCLLTDIIDDEVMESAGPSLKVISNYAVGFNNVNVSSATKRKILVTNTPGVLTNATAELAWALLFAAARRVVESDAFTRAKKFKGWEPLLYLGQDIYGKTLGVVGTGRIGTLFAKMSKGFNMRVLYHNRRKNESLKRELDAKNVSLETLLKESDFISLHVPLTEQTRHMIGKRELEMMKPSSILVNTSRGPVVNEKELYLALKSKKISAAGLDVYEFEPKIVPGLIRCPNVVCTPHIASATTETRNRMAVLAAENLVAALTGARPKHMVNPEVIRA